MDFFNYGNFFDLSSFAHKALFAQTSYVWEALPRVSAYLLSLPLGKIETEIPDGAFLINPELISIGAGTVVEPGAYIKGPCIIGKNATVRHGAYVRGNLIAGDRCVIGHDSEFKNAILLNDAHAAHFAYVGDTILGNRVNLGAGTVCANLKLDRGPVVVHGDGRRIDTGMRKFGAIIGDDVQTGCHTVLNPGTLLGKGVVSHPGVNCGGYIPEGHIVRAANKPLVVKA